MKNAMFEIYKNYTGSGKSSLCGTNIGALQEIRNAWYNNKTSDNPIIIPAVHLEMGSSVNNSNATLLRSIQFRESASEELAQAVIEFFNEKN